MPDTASTYQKLVERLRELYDLGSVLGILGWDQQVVMPPKAAPARARQFSRLAAHLHKLATDPQIGQWLDELEAHAGELSEDQKVVVREVRRSYERATKIPEEFVREKAAHTSEAYQVWVKAREESDFARFAPYLAKNVELARREAEYLGYQESPYDPLLDKYDPGLTEAFVERVFSRLRETLKGLIAEIVATGIEPVREKLFSPHTWPEEKQKELGIKVIQRFGYDLEAGRVDTAVHPFCGGYIGDVRVTTRYNLKDPLDSLMGLMHECGHALYNQGLNPDTWGTPLSEPVGTAVHESQSRMWENLVGRSRSFWEWLWPLFQEHFPEQTRGMDLEQVYLAVKQVKPDFIRVEADEVTYGMHIILRFELERALIKGELQVEELPARWNELMEELLGITPPNDRLGVLQDIHWSGASFGYFPSYQLGNLIAAQLYQQAERELGDLEEDYRRGEFGRLLKWLREKVHRQGKRYLTQELVEKVTGAPLSPDPFIEHLKKDYLSLYQSRAASAGS